MIYRLRKLVSGALTCAIAILVLATPALCRQIEFWTTGHSSATTKWIDEELLPRFQKERRIQVVHKNVRMSAEVEAELLSGAGPDVLIDSATNMVRFGRGNTLEPLARYLTRWKDQKTLFPNLLKAPYPKLPSLETEPITMYALPIEVMPSGIAFNKDAFSRAGLSATNTPNSWQELEAAAKKTVLRWDNRVVRPGLDANWSGFDLFLNFLRLNGETGVTNDYRKARLDTDRAAETLNYLAGLYQLPIRPPSCFPAPSPIAAIPRALPTGWQPWPTAVRIWPYILHRETPSGRKSWVSSLPAAPRAPSPQLGPP